jgi:hypothetical protein
MSGAGSISRQAAILAAAAGYVAACLALIALLASPDRMRWAIDLRMIGTAFFYVLIFSFPGYLCLRLALRFLRLTGLPAFALAGAASGLLTVGAMALVPGQAPIPLAELLQILARAGGYGLVAGAWFGRANVPGSGRRLRPGKARSDARYAPPAPQRRIFAAARPGFALWLGEGGGAMSGTLGVRKCL